jgi:hypothetical protein
MKLVGLTDKSYCVDRMRVRIILLRFQRIEVTQQLRVIKSWQGLVGTSSLETWLGRSSFSSAQSVIFVYRGTAQRLCLTSHANRLTIRGDVDAIVKLNLMLVAPRIWLESSHGKA